MTTKDMQAAAANHLCKPYYYWFFNYISLLPIWHEERVKTVLNAHVRKHQPESKLRIEDGYENVMKYKENKYL